jgi:arabinan endo-1,5-alpha-L-arabinosidase
MLPYATDGETISDTGYDKDEVVGEYYVINQEMNVDAEIAEPFKLVLTAKGNVYGKDVSGTWESKDNSYYVHITYDDKEYSGVFCKMNDEAGTQVMTFTAVGVNRSIWGVKYFE